MKEEIKTAPCLGWCNKNLPYKKGKRVYYCNSCLRKKDNILKKSSGTRFYELDEILQN